MYTVITNLPPRMFTLYLGVDTGLVIWFIRLVMFTF